MQGITQEQLRPYDGLFNRIVGVTERDLLVHDEKAPQPTLAYLLSKMTYPKFPVPVGVFRSVEKPTYEDTIQKQADEVTQRLGLGDIEKLMRGPETWTVS